LPCPFCGGKPYQPQSYGDFERDSKGNRVDYGSFIQCQDCGANIFRAPKAREKLIPAWNRRSNTEPQRNDQPQEWKLSRAGTGVTNSSGEPLFECRSADGAKRAVAFHNAALA